MLRYAEASVHAMQKYTVPLAAMDCTGNLDTCSRLGVRSFPTLKYFSGYKGSKVEDCKAARTEAGVLDYERLKAQEIARKHAAMDSKTEL